MSGKVIHVRVGFDDEAGVWFVLECSLPGLNIEGSSFEELVSNLKAAIADLIECQDDGEDYEVPIEIIANTKTRVRVSAAA